MANGALSRKQISRKLLLACGRDLVADCKWEDNPEYCRALVELIGDVTGGGQDDRKVVAEALGLALPKNY